MLNEGNGWTKDEMYFLQTLPTCTNLQLVNAMSKTTQNQPVSLDVNFSTIIKEKYLGNRGRIRWGIKYIFCPDLIGLALLWFSRT